ncbi:hypothetical protein Cgig2_031205 [Carnegiea gigantea]|uniref:Uncharacterized protein n=1 Tax=Carnegiea gigantea TaxID=171969 RepID=A0A9Q1KQK7_9CARY|nr:hypothetical protein Cgig2_031205 [Carnegiea gigantea]
MEGKKSNKIREIVRLQQILRKWKKLATTNSSKTSNSSSNDNNGGGGGGNKGIKFLKKTLSFSDNNNNSTNNTHAPSSASGEHVPKGYLAVCVGKELKRYVIPTHYLGHQAFGILLREAEEEFGFHQEGVLKIPSDVSVFERILQMVESGGSGSGTGRRSLENHNSALFAPDFHHYHYQELDVVSMPTHCAPISGQPNGPCTGGEGDETDPQYPSL